MIEEFQEETAALMALHSAPEKAPKELKRLRRAEEERLQGRG